MPMLTYTLNNDVSPKDFIHFWSQRYVYRQGEAAYDENIGKELTEQRIVDLFSWKNGTPLSEKKRISVLSNFAARQPELAEFASDMNPGDFLNRFRDGGVIFRIFWLHCLHPNFPIYDQHVHRAMSYILNGTTEEIPGNDELKIRAYIDRYVPFYRGLREKVVADGREVDKALWAFGKFIKNNNLPVAGK